MLKRLMLKFFLLSVLLNINLALAENIKGVVVQGNGDKAQFERALKLTSNMHEILKSTKFEVVVFGPTVKLLTALSDEVPLIQKVQAEGIKVIACGRSLKSENIKQADLAPDVPVVPFGAVYIVERQKAGWQYFKP
ncbi:MAG: DsrE family protein [Gammaproteobacteria bacterium]|nr:DsrE family protein [Gammaproteobacteria bacterium]